MPSKPRIKRSLDIATSAAALVLLSPVFFVLAGLARLGSPGPVFHSDWRIGLGGRRFRMYKFRSMTAGTAAQRAELLERYGRENHPHVLSFDPRITAGGRWLRSTALDELPQLWNVLRGDMSLVGPRPLLEADLQLSVPDADLWRRRRREVRPGLTGPWQIRSRRDPAASAEVMVSEDLAYVDHASLRGDLTLLAQTPRAILVGLRGGEAPRPSEAGEQVSCRPSDC